jgi:hypothetical protein
MYLALHVRCVLSCLDSVRCDSTYGKSKCAINFPITVLVSVVVLFFLGETIRTSFRTLQNRHRYPIKGCSPAVRPVAAWPVISRLVMRAGCLHRGEVFFNFSDCGSGSSPSCWSGSASRTVSKPDHDGGKGLDQDTDPDPSESGSASWFILSPVS